MATGGRSPNPYLLVPVQNAKAGSNGVVSPTASTSASVAQHVSNLSSTASNLAASSSGANVPGANPNAFRAPAHKHAHHLHSIPPREKSTRTLIIDYMLWVHGRTRFAQARAELGMTDRTGGPGTPQYAHRQHPEKYEEEEDFGSDGEDPVTLKARAGDPGRPHNDDEDERLRSQDLNLARTLRLRAEGVEKVITSMLDQAPAPHPVPAEELLTPPTSPRIQPASTPTSGPHALPNGVRLRLSLGTMINDLFARQAPVPPYRHRKQTSMSPAPPVMSPGGAPADLGLPKALETIATISASCPDKPHVQPWTLSSSSLRPGPGPLYPVQPRSPPMANPRTRALYNAGADPSTANSPPAFRCPRHLHTGCEICVEAKSTPRGSNRGHATSLGGDANGAGRTQYWKAMPGGVSPEGGGISGWQEGSGIGSGLLQPKSTGTVLRRKTKDAVDGDPTTQNGAGNTKLSELIPRFIRLSAMVAAEMGREARGEEEEPAAEEKEEGDDDSPMSSPERQGWDGPPPDLEPLPPPATPVPSSSDSAVKPYDNQTAMYASALLPSREWYLLLAGLLTRAVLEGYLTAGWQGPDAVDCLLKVGLGKQPPHAEEDKDEFAEFDPDELPSLLDATRMLFPALRDRNKEVKGQAEEEYENEMETRLRRFYDIPQSTPDLSTHMEDLAWQYPAEPVERAAVRFCEAIEKWRGKPELETYKKKPPASSSPIVVMDTPSSSSMSMEALQSPATGTHTPTIAGPHPPKGRSTRKPSIQVYFPTPFPLPLASRSAAASGWNQRGSAKRMRSPEPDARPSPAKVPRGDIDGR